MDTCGYISFGRKGNKRFIFSDLETRLLRGGPALRFSPFWQNTLIFNTDKSKRVSFKLQNNSSVSSDGISRLYALKPGLTFRVGNHAYITSEFNYTHNIDNFIYVAQKPANDGMQYIMARIKQQTYNFTLRFNYNFTPDLSIQYYGSPFISIGGYSYFKRAADAHAQKLENRFHSFTESEISYDDVSGNYNVVDGVNKYSFAKPDFSFREFRSNLVFRWEYRPGSTIYIVWENNLHSNDSYYYSSFQHNVSDLFGAAQTNVFMVKLNFWSAI